jgi:hypothetical protein
MRVVIAFILAASAGACVLDETPDDLPDDTPSPLEGTYSVQSRVTLGEMTQIDLATATLRAFSQSPGGKLLSLARQASDPALATIDAAVSPAVRDRLEGWINTEIDKALIESTTPRLFADDVRGIATTILGQFSIESTLTFAPSKVTHSFTALNFRPASLDVLIPIGGFKADTITQLTTATVSTDGELTLGDQRFGLAFGDHAWQALGLASAVLFGGDLRTTFVDGLSCPALASAIALRCVETSCVGHQAELQAFCAHSIELFVTELGRSIAAFDLDVFRFVEGNAQLIDDNGDGVSERIVDGTWSAETDIGLGPRAAVASFTAERMR